MMMKIGCFLFGLIAVSMAERLELVGSLGMVQWAGGIFVRGNYAYIAGGRDGGTSQSYQYLAIVNVQDPRHPSVVSTCLIPSNRASDVFVMDTLAFVAAFDSGVQVVNIANPLSPHVIGNCDTLRSIYSISGADTIVVASSIFIGGTYTLNVADPTHPKTVGSIADSDHDLFVQWPLAFITNAVHAFIFDISDPTKPIWLNSTTVIYAGSGVFAKDSLLFTTEPFNIYNIVDPKQPKLLGWVYEEPEFGEGYNHLFASGHYVYVVVYPVPTEHLNGGVVVYDVSDPTHPKCTAKYVKMYADYVDIFVVGARIYALTDDALHIFDHITGVEEKKNPAQIAQPYLQIIPNPAQTQFVVRFGLSRAGTATLQVYDVLGRSVRTLDRGASMLHAGVYSVQWDGRDDAGNRMPAGVYLLRLKVSGNIAITQKAVLLR